MTKVSILIATYNYGKYVLECLESIKSQDYEDYEVIIYDDASTDNTQDAIIDFKWRNPEYCDLVAVVYVKGDGQKGQSTAKNQCLKYAIGEYIFFLDADNLFNSPDALRTFVNALDKNPKAGFAYCDRLAFGDRNGILKSAPINKHIKNNNWVDGNMISRRAAFGEYDEHLVKLTDWDRVLHMLTSGWKGLYIPEPLVAYRFHDSNTGTVHMSRHGEMHEYIYQKYKNKQVTL